MASATIVIGDLPDGEHVNVKVNFEPALDDESLAHHVAAIFMEHMGPGVENGTVQIDEESE